MISDDLNQIRGVVKEEINTALEPVVKKLDVLWDQTVKLTEDVDEVKVTVNKLEGRADQIDRKLDKVIDTQIDHGNRLEDIEQLPVIAHELKLKKHK